MLNHTISKLKMLNKMWVHLEKLIGKLAKQFNSSIFTIVCKSLSKKWSIKRILTLSKSRKYGLQAERTTLCAVKVQLSQASVTSTKSSWSLRLRNELRMLKWKSFHLSEYCCSPPLDEDEEAAMASVPLGLTTRGAIVFTPRHSTFKHLRLSFSSLVSKLNFLNAPGRASSSLHRMTENVTRANDAQRVVFFAMIVMKKKPISQIKADTREIPSVLR